MPPASRNFGARIDLVPSIRCRSHRRRRSGADPVPFPQDPVPFPQKAWIRCRDPVPFPQKALPQSH
jgi:hypothetical protein